LYGGHQLVGVARPPQRLGANNGDARRAHRLRQRDLGLECVDDGLEGLRRNSAAVVHDVAQANQLARVGQWLQFRPNAGAYDTSRSCRKNMDAVAADIDGCCDARRRLYGHASSVAVSSPSPLGRIG
jgi:hypothetical protein